MFARGNKSVGIYEFGHLQKAYFVPSLPQAWGTREAQQVVPAIQGLASPPPPCAEQDADTQQLLSVSLT